MIFSVITATFNSNKYLTNTILSVLSQDYSDFEYILIDGGSTDGTLDIIKFHSARDSRIRWVSEPDRGISDAFNKGVRLATGELIGIINADDEYTLGTLQAVADEYLAHPDCEVFHGDMLRQEGDAPLFVLRPSLVDCRIWRQMPLNHPATFVTKRAYRNVGEFNVNLRIAMDYDLILRLYLEGCRFRYIERTLAIMRYGGASDDCFVDGLREFREITVRQGYARWKAELWFFWKVFKGYGKIFLRKTGLQGLLKLHPRFRTHGV